MTFIKSLWNGEKKLAFTFWTVLIAGTLIVEIVSYGFTGTIHDVLSESFSCESNCNTALKWFSMHLSFSTIMIIVIFLKLSYLVFATICFYRSAMNDKSDKVGIKTGFAFVFWMIIVPPIVVLDLGSYVNAVTYGSDYARAGSVFFF